MKSMLIKMKNVFLFATIMFATNYAQSQTVVTGKVTDKGSAPVADVNVLIKEANGGATTDADGNFKITVPAAGKTLIFSLVGYQSQQVPVSATVNVTLKVLNKELGEIVVVGYGNKKKGDLTASVTSISSKDFQKGAISTPEQLIAGKVAGVSVVSNGGAPGSGSTIRIRGGASLSASNDPLIVIDGVALSNSGIAGAPNPLSLINPNDIENFTILKDAAAAAIYGTRASNGVILITTKKGKKGSPTLSFSTSVNFSTPAKTADVMSADEFRTYVKANGTPAQIALMGTANTNWQDEIYENAIGTDNNLSVAGVYKTLPYRISLGYFNQNGILKNDNLARSTVGINLNPKFLKDHLKVDVGFKYANTNTTFSDRGAIGSAVSFDPTKSVNSGNTRYGGYTQWLDAGSSTGLLGLAPRNPVALIDQRSDIGKSNRIIANAQVEYKLHFFPAIRASVNVATDRSTGKGNIIVADSAATAYKVQSIVNNTQFAYGVNNQYKQENENNTIESFLYYNKDFKKINTKLDVMAGTAYQTFKTTNTFFDNFGKNGVLISKTQFPNDVQENRLFSYIGRINLAIDNKYLLTANFRRDGSSRFSPTRRYANFYGVSAAWKLKEEKFLKNIDAINDLKLRVSYGATGQQDGLGNYDYLSFYSQSNQTAQYQFGNTYYTMSRPGAYDGNRGWEETATKNIGLDFSVANNRIGGSIDVYDRLTKDLLSPKTQSAGSNFSNIIVANIGNMRNYGAELNLNVIPVKKDKLTVELGFNFTYNKNEITKLTEFPDPNFAGFEIGGISGGTGSNIQIHTVGNQRASYYVYKQVYDPATQKPIENLFVDLDGDGLITDRDRYRYKNPDATYLFGFSPTVNYKKWTGGFVARASVGNYVYNNNASSRGTKNSILNPLGFLANGSRSVLETGFVGAGNRFYSSDYYVENASFLRMDNVSLTYNAGKLIRSSNAGFRFNFNVQNVFVSTKYKGIDPEVNGGIDNTIYARPRIFSFGVNVDLNLKK